MLPTVSVLPDSRAIPLSDAQMLAASKMRTAASRKNVTMNLSSASHSAEALFVLPELNVTQATTGRTAGAGHHYVEMVLHTAKSVSYFASWDKILVSVLILLLHHCE